MRDLRVIGVSEDGAHVLFKDASSGADSPTYRVPLDERLHAALRGDQARLGQLEIRMDAQITPREIQSRIRAGDSADAVAASAGVPLDRILRYAQPVLDERAHVADRARRGNVRRSNGEASHLTLDESTAAKLAPMGLALTDIDVDSFRTDDGRWLVASRWTLKSKPREAVWAFDATRTSVSPVNDDARWLAGEIEDPAAPRPAPAAPIRDVAEAAAAKPHLAVVPSPIDALIGSSDDAHFDSGRDADADPDADADADVVSEVVAQAPSTPEAHESSTAGSGSGSGDPDTAPVPTVASRNRRPSVPPLSTHERGAPSPSRQSARQDERLRLSDLSDHVEGDPEDDTDQPRSAQKRSTIPSWDEIMFGRKGKDS